MLLGRDEVGGNGLVYLFAQTKGEKGGRRNITHLRKGHEGEKACRE